MTVTEDSHRCTSTPFGLKRGSKAAARLPVSARSNPADDTVVYILRKTKTFYTYGELVDKFRLRQKDIRVFHNVLRDYKNLL